MTEMTEMSDSRLLMEIDRAAANAGRTCATAGQNRNDQVVALIWEVTLDFISEGAAVCGPLFQPPEIARRRERLQDAIGPTRTNELTDAAHKVGCLIKEVTRRTELETIHGLAVGMVSDHKNATKRLEVIDYFLVKAAREAT